jgi:hypothetical protein
MTGQRHRLAMMVLLASPILLAALWRFRWVLTGDSTFTVEMYVATFLVMVAGVSAAIGMYEWEQGRLSRAGVVPHLLSPLGFLCLAATVCSRISRIGPGRC